MLRPTKPATPIRVQVPTYSDRWMMGDKYGFVVQIIRSHKTDTATGTVVPGDVYEVELDKSGKRRRYWAADCVVQ